MAGRGHCSWCRPAIALLVLWEPETPRPGRAPCWSRTSPDPVDRLQPGRGPGAEARYAASRVAGSSPPRGIGGRGIPCFMRVDAGFLTTPVVNDHCAGGCQGGAGRPEVVAAQQDINRMRASRGGRDENPHHWPGGAAAGTITQSGPPGPASLVVGVRPGRLADGGGHGPAPRKCVPIKPAQTVPNRLTRDLALVPGGTFGPKHPGRPPCPRGP